MPGNGPCAAGAVGRPGLYRRAIGRPPGAQEPRSSGRPGAQEPRSSGRPGALEAALGAGLGVPPVS
ncbi:MAG TPA: hypothetical protein VFW50_36605 [Streptosporangiaceae bacterium]|nr:hypothetical protein [Streptosporangiaceae bacterium]